MPDAKDYQREFDAMMRVTAEKAARPLELTAGERKSFNASVRARMKKGMSREQATGIAEKSVWFIREGYKKNDLSL